MGKRRIPYQFFVVTIFLFFVALILIATIATWSIAGPKQEIWYHTGYPGGIGGHPSGLSVFMGPTKMPAVFEAIWRHRLVEAGQLHTDSPNIVGRAPPIDLDSLREVHTDLYLKALFSPANLAALPAPRGFQPGTRALQGVGC